MELHQATNILRQRLLDQWDESVLPVVFENSASQGPDSGYLYTEVKELSGDHVAFGGPGNNEYRDEALFLIVVCVPRGSMVGTVENYAAQLRAMFKPQDLAATGIRIGQRRIIKNGATLQFSKFWINTVSVRFFCDRFE